MATAQAARKLGRKRLQACGNVRMSTFPAGLAAPKPRERARESMAHALQSFLLAKQEAGIAVRRDPAETRIREAA